MKMIVMTTDTKGEAVKMGKAGIFTTGVPVPVEDDALADSLLKRNFPKFEEAPEEAQTGAGKKLKK